MRKRKDVLASDDARSVDHSANELKRREEIPHREAESDWHADLGEVFYTNSGMRVPAHEVV